MQNPDRSQPAHALVRGDLKVLVDCGEGAMRALKRAGIEFRTVNHIVLSHHHFDHIGSLFACLGLNMMIMRDYPLMIYGPAGTKKIIDGLCDACDVPNATGFGVPGQKMPHPREVVKVQEINPGDSFEIEDIKVSCCENTHYRPEEEFGTDGPVSLTLRFDAPDRSIVFTGDTGESPTVEAFAKGADLLIGELIDVEFTMSVVKRFNPNVPQERLNHIRFHLSQHHLSPEQLGELATKTGVDHVVAVHFAPGFMTPDMVDGYAARIASKFAGTVSISEDLGRY